MDKIVVTGMGIVSALGVGANDTLAALRREETVAGKLKYLQTNHTELPCAEVPLSDAEMCALLGIDPQEVITRTALMGIVAMREALKSAKLVQVEGRRIAFINGTTVGGMEKSEQYYLDFLENNTRNAYILAHECGACTERMADDAGIFDYVTTMCTACSSAANSMALGANLLKTNMVDAVVAGGSECITKFHLNGFNTLMILDKEPCRPFDDTRAGLNLGEGAGYLVLERESDARNRGAQALCYLSGYGNACDAFHQTASSDEGTGAVMAMSEALAMSGLQPSQISYINAHGTGTKNNDLSEGRAIARIFGDKIPYVSSTKSMTGHTTSASGGVEAVVSILSIQNRMIPANIHFNNPMPELPFVPVNHVIENVEVNHVLSNAFGFGGNDSSLIFSKI